MNPDKERYFAKTYVALVLECADYIEANIEKLLHIESKDAICRILNNRKLIKKLIGTYRTISIDHGMGFQIIGIATALKTIIKDKKHITKDVNLEFFEKDNYIYLKQQKQ